MTLAAHSVTRNGFGAIAWTCVEVVMVRERVWDGWKLVCLGQPDERIDTYMLINASGFTCRYASPSIGNPESRVPNEIVR